MKREFHTRIDLMKPKCESQTLDSQATQVQTHDQHAKLSEVSVVGQEVMAGNYSFGSTLSSS